MEKGRSKKIVQIRDKNIEARIAFYKKVKIMVFNY